MTSRKVKLAWIENDRARNTCFRKRKRSLLKKVSEISTLCGVDAFAIVYGRENDEPDVCPSLPMVAELLEKFRSIPEIERTKKMMNMEDYLTARTAKLEDQLRRTRKKNYKLELNLIMHQIHQGKPLREFENGKITSLALLMEEKMREIRDRIELLEKDLDHPQGGSVVAEASFDLNKEDGKEIEEAGANAANEAGNNVESEVRQPHENHGIGTKRGRADLGFRLMGVDIGGTAPGSG